MRSALRQACLLSAALLSLVTLPPLGSARDHAPLLSLASPPVAASVATQLAVEADPALTAAREITRRVRTFHNFRGEIPLGTWSALPNPWRVRTSSRCRQDAARLGLSLVPVERPLPTPVPTPVVLSGTVHGIRFRPVQSDRAIELSCELSTRLPAFAKLLRAHGVRTVHVNSSYRDQPRVSFHTFGFALDVAAFESAHGMLSVARDFEVTPTQSTCSASPTSERGRALQQIACASAESGLFSSVLTPNYNEGHRDHFHFDVRPDDPRLFVR